MKALLKVFIALTVFSFALRPPLTDAIEPGKMQQLTAPDQVPEGLAKSDWQSIRAAYEAGRHAFQPIEGGWQARNPGQQWTTKFDGRGFLTEPRDGGWQWGLELKSYGFGEKQRAIGGTPAVKADGQRLSYQWDVAVQEWWVNDARGLEHGFTVQERPAAPLDAQASPLHFLLAVRGSLVAQVGADGQGVEFRDAAGATVLTYAGLKVWDADGKVLASHFASAEGGVRLLVEEQGARYPLTIDPIAQQAYLKASQVSNFDEFGSSVAVSGNTVVVGAHFETSSTTGVNSTPNESVSAAGAAYVFVRSGTTWTQQAYLKASQVNAGDEFGISVAVSGNTVVVGAYLEDSSTTGVNSTPDELASAAGAAYVFVRSGTTWAQQAYLKPAAVGTTQASDNFGISVAVSGDTVVVGAYHEDSRTEGVNTTPNENANNAGAAYVFVRSGTTWTQQAYLKASQVTTQDIFGYSVAVSGDTVVVGALGEDSNTTGVNSTPNSLGDGAGAAYVFVRGGTTWTQQAYLKASQVNAGDAFGISVAVSGNTVVVGAYLEDSSTTGVNSTPDELASGAGAAYVFVRSGTTWTQQAYLKASQVNLLDFFGSSVAVSGNTVVVGAYCEDSSTTGVNSTPDELGDGSGAAYIFTGLGPATPAAIASTTGGWVNAGNFTVGISGNTANTNNWPAAQSPDKATDNNLSTKFLLFKTANAALGLTPVNPSLAYSTLALTTAEDAVERDPASYQIYGSAAPLPTAAGSNVSIAGLTLIASGALALPDARNAAPTVVTFSNLTAYAAYLVVFPTVKNAAAANSTQVAEVELLFLPDTEPPTGGTVTLLPASPVDAGATLTVSFPGWTDLSPPLSYEVLVDDVVVSAQGASSSRNITGPATPGSTHSLKGRIYDALNQVTSVTQSFNVNTALQSWRKLYFGTTVNAGSAANSFDFDLDGLVNLFEFAFGLDPTQSSSAQLPQVQLSGGNLFYSFTQPAGVSGFTYGAEWSTTLALGSWTPLPDTGTPPQHLFSVPIAGMDRLFIRLAVALPPRPLTFSSAVATFQQAAPYIIANSLLPDVPGWGVFGGTQTDQMGYFIFSTPADGDVLELVLRQNFGGQAWIQQFEVAVTTDAVPNTAGGGNWTTWVPTTLNSTSTTLSLVGGTNILSTGTAATATYTLRGAFPVQGITGVRLTVHPYDYDTGDALPATLGRSANGNFVLSEFKATADP